MKKRALRITAIFFSAMLILTFCSRTIYRSMLVKVRVAKPTGGTLKYEYVAEDFFLSADKYLYEYMPFPLEQGLTIERVHIRLGEEVEAGDPLISFYSVDGEYLLDQTEKALRRAEHDLDVWKNELASARIQLETKMGSAQSQAEREIVQSEMRLLEKGIWNGRYMDEVSEGVEAAQLAVDYLTALKENGWTMAAEFDGMICSVEVEVGNSYEGISPVCRLAEEGEAIFLHIDSLGLPDSADENWNWMVRFQTQQEIVDCEEVCVEDGVMTVMLPEGIGAFGIQSILIKLESPYEQFLVPCTAVTRGCVYLLETDIGDWGEEILIVCEKRVVTGNSDGENCVIREGLKASDRMVVYASGELMDKQVVILDNYE